MLRVITEGTITYFTRPVPTDIDPAQPGQSERIHTITVLVVEQSWVLVSINSVVPGEKVGLVCALEFKTSCHEFQYWWSCPQVTMSTYVSHRMGLESCIKPQEFA